MNPIDLRGGPTHRPKLSAWLDLIFFVSATKCQISDSYWYCACTCCSHYWLNSQQGGLFFFLKPWFTIFIHKGKDWKFEGLQNKKLDPFSQAEQCAHLYNTLKSLVHPTFTRFSWIFCSKSHSGRHPFTPDYQVKNWFIQSHMELNGCMIFSCNS